MKRPFPGFFFRFCRFIVRPFFRATTYLGEEKCKTPACYVAHYKNSDGPIAAMANLKIPVHPWVLSPFCSWKECFRHYYGYTFTQRFGWPKILAMPVCFILSLVIVPLYHSMGAIPVFRGSSKIIHTIRQSAELLARGENVIIFPDIDYTSKDEQTKDIYEGFLHLEKYYFKATGEHLAFIPVHTDVKMRYLEIGNTIRFTGDVPFSKERSQVARRLTDAMNQHLVNK